MRRFLFILAFLLLATPASAATYLVSWNDTADNETGWQVEQKVEGGSYSLVTTTAANVMVYSHATGSSNYRYRVRAVLPSGYGPYSNEACVPTACGASPEFPHGTGTLAAEPSRLVAGVSGGTNGTARFLANCNQATVASAISAASAGDTIVVPAGSCSWASTVTLTKAVRLRGAGSGSTTITSAGANPLVRLLPSDLTTNPEMEVTGFTFNNGNGRHAIDLGQGNFTSNITVFQNKVNIHHNAFTGNMTQNNNGHYIYNYNMGGVVWKNTFTGVDQQLSSMGWGDYPDPIWTLLQDTRGTANALYIEDNIFNWTATYDDYLSDCQFGGTRRVWRYNTITHAGSSNGSGFIDFHGAYSTSSSCFGDEAYGNKAVMTNNGSIKWLTARGGQGLAFYNDVTTSGSVYNGQYFSWASLCPTGTTSPNTLERLRAYAWNNRKNTTTAAQGWNLSCEPANGECNYTCDTSTNFPEVDKQVFNYAPTFNGTSGVGCGPSLPTPSGYTERVAYWVTTQSCSSVSGLVGDIVNNPTRGKITGTLYTVQSGAWVSTYTPYAYPHPLRQGQ